MTSGEQSQEAIKVVIRFHGAEELTEAEEALWTVRENGKGKHEVSTKKNGMTRSYTFDNVLVGEH